MKDTNAFQNELQKAIKKTLEKNKRTKPYTVSFEIELADESQAENLKDVIRNGIHNWFGISKLLEKDGKTIRKIKVKRV